MQRNGSLVVVRSAENPVLACAACGDCATHLYASREYGDSGICWACVTAERFRVPAPKNDKAEEEER